MVPLARILVRPPPGRGDGCYGGRRRWNDARKRRRTHARRDEDARDAQPQPGHAAVAAARQPEPWPGPAVAKRGAGALLDPDPAPHREPAVFCYAVRAQPGPPHWGLPAAA